MRSIILLTAACLIFQTSQAQQRQVNLTLQSFVSHSKHVDSHTAAEAVRIANIVLNSQEFRDSVLTYNFKCENYGDPCSGSKIPGSTVLDSTYKFNTFALSLTMNKCLYEYGHSEEGKHYIESCYGKLRKDDKVLPFAYIYAYHICHEYMHIVGYYHTDHKDDVAERVGYIGYYILKRWFLEGRRL